MSTTEERAAEPEALRRQQVACSTPSTSGSARSKFLTSVLDKIFPDHWSFMVGEIAMDSLIILIATGIYLTFFYVPSGDRRRLRARPAATCTPRSSAST